MEDPPNKRLEDLYAFGALYASNPVRAFDDLYDYVDELLLDGYAMLVDRLLAEIDVGRLPQPMLVGLLTLTKGWVRALPMRRGFFARVEERLEREEGPDKAGSLLRGLSP